jgi:hypothetical protein
MKTTIKTPAVKPAAAIRVSTKVKAGRARGAVAAYI